MEALSLLTEENLGVAKPVRLIGERGKVDSRFSRVRS
jgi:hypothetical protein